MPDQRLGPFTRKQWLLGGVGGGVAFFGIRWWKNRHAAAAASAQTADTAGGTIPGGGSGASTTSPLPTTLAAWEQALLGFGTDPIKTLNAATNWLAGNCVDQGGYSGLTAAIQSIGLPPGMTTLPVLSVCSGSNSTSPPAGGGAGGGSSGNPPPPQNQPPPPPPVITPNTIGEAINTTLSNEAASWAANPTAAPPSAQVVTEIRNVVATNPAALPGGFIPASANPNPPATGLPPNSTNTSFTTGPGGTGWITPQAAAAIQLASPGAGHPAGWISPEAINAYLASHPAT